MDWSIGQDDYGWEYRRQLRPAIDDYGDEVPASEPEAIVPDLEAVAS